MSLFVCVCVCALCLPKASTHLLISQEQLSPNTRPGKQIITNRADDSLTVSVNKIKKMSNRNRRRRTGCEERRETGKQTEGEKGGKKQVIRSEERKVEGDSPNGQIEAERGLCHMLSLIYMLIHTIKRMRERERV